jgi:hypothetical protein
MGFFAHHLSPVAVLDRMLSRAGVLFVRKAAYRRGHYKWPMSANKDMKQGVVAGRPCSVTLSSRKERLCFGSRCSTMTFGKLASNLDG